MFIFIVPREIEIEGNQLSTGDAIGIYDTEHILINSSENSELVFVEVPMAKGISL